MTSSNLTLSDAVTSPSRPALIASVSLYVLSLVVGIAGNAAIVHIIVTNRNLRTGVNAYIANMAVVDLLGCALLVPLRMLFYLEQSSLDHGGFALCQMAVFFHGLVDAGRMFFLAAISFERYQSVANPFQRDKAAAVRRAFITLGILWVVMLVYAALQTVFFYDTVMYEFCMKWTYLGSWDYQLWGSIDIYFVLPLSLMTVVAVVVCYALMFRILYVQRAKMLGHSRKATTNKVAPAEGSVLKVKKAQTDTVKVAGVAVTSAGCASGSAVTHVSGAGGSNVTSVTSGASSNITTGVSVTYSVCNASTTGSDVTVVSAVAPSITNVIAVSPSVTDVSAVTSSITDVSGVTPSTSKVSFTNVITTGTPSVTNISAGARSVSTCSAVGGKQVAYSGETGMSAGSADTLLHTDLKRATSSSPRAVSQDGAKLHAEPIVSSTSVRSTQSSTQLHKRPVPSLLSPLGKQQVCAQPTVRSNRSQSDVGGRVVYLSETKSGNSVTRRLSYSHGQSVSGSGVRDWKGAPPQCGTATDGTVSVTADGDGTHHGRSLTGVRSAEVSQTTDGAFTFNKHSSPCLGQQEDTNSPSRQVYVTTCSSALSIPGVATQSSGPSLNRDRCNSCYNSFTFSIAHKDRDDAQVQSVAVKPDQANNENSLTLEDMDISAQEEKEIQFSPLSSRSPDQHSQTSGVQSFGSLVPPLSPLDPAEDKIRTPQTVAETDTQTSVSNFAQGSAVNVIADTPGSQPSQHWNDPERTATADRSVIAVSHPEVPMGTKSTCVVANSEIPTAVTQALHRSFAQAREPSASTQTMSSSIAKTSEMFSATTVQTRPVSVVHTSAVSSTTAVHTKSANLAQTSGTFPTTTQTRSTNLSQTLEVPMEKTRSGLTASGSQKQDVQSVKVVEIDGTEHVEQVSNSQNIQGDVCLFNPKNRLQGRRRVEVRVAKRLVIIFLSFVLLWLPYPCAVLALHLIYMDSNHPHPPTSTPSSSLSASSSPSSHVAVPQIVTDVIAVFSALSMVTAAVNPVFYGLANVTIRSIIVTALKNMCRCCSRQRCCP